MNLEDALEQGRQAIEAGIADAEKELGELRRRCVELERLIARGRAALGIHSDITSTVDATLHAALEIVLRDNGNEWMSVTDLAAEVNRRALYRMRDGRPVEPSQIHARVRNYGSFFEKEESRVRLRYLFETSRLDSTGAFWAALTKVERVSDGARMGVVSRVAFSVNPPDNRAPEVYVAELSEERARRLVADGHFEPGAENVATLTTTGWRPEEP